MQQLSKQNFASNYQLKKDMQKNSISNMSQLKVPELKFNGKSQSKSVMGWHQNAQTSPIDEYNVQFKMKEKFEELYRRIQKISKSVNSQQLKVRIQRKLMIGSSEENSNKQMRQNKTNAIRQQLVKLGFKSKQFSHNKNRSQQYNSQNLSLHISTSSQPKQSLEMFPNIRIVNNSKCRPSIKLMKQNNMSNNIEDYLSVQKITLRDLQPSAIGKQLSPKRKRKQLKLAHSISTDQALKPQIQTFMEQNNIDEDSKNGNEQQFSEIFVQRKLNNNANKIMNFIKIPKKFNIPFQTYHYRDLVWRIAYSNQSKLYFPENYDYRVKVYVGSGNNSRLVKSMIMRRSWFQITQKIQQANFVWTQIKVINVFSSQPKQQNMNIKDKFLHSNLLQTNKSIYISKSIWTEHQQSVFKKYFNSNIKVEAKMNQTMKLRNKNIVKIWKNQPTMATIKQIQNKKTSEENNNCTHKIHNHFVNSYLVGNKKALFQTMTDYYTSRGDNVFNYLPMTFHICNGLDDEKYFKFLNFYYNIAKKVGENLASKYNAWIVKPGQNTNRGQGITVCLTLQQIKKILKQKHKNSDGSNRTYIVQKYIERPLLYKKRKFDLRHYIMINCSNGMMKGYWFNEGYVRTTSSEYTLKQGHGSVHLTNDAVQKQLAEYGKYEKGNKISYEELNQYLVKISHPLSFWNDAYPRMKKIATDVIRACAPHLDQQRRTNFQIYGLDFMLGEQLDVWLIEVNTNPCLELSCPLLAKIIPKMVQNTLQICLDPLIPAPTNFTPKSKVFKQDCIEYMGYELVYDERFEQQTKSTVLQLNDETLKKQQDDCFEDDGEDWNQD